MRRDKHVIKLKRRIRGEGESNAMGDGKRGAIPDHDASRSGKWLGVGKDTGVKIGRAHV